MKRYSDYEIELFIDEITGAALEAIEKAAGESAKAAVLAMLEREAAALHEAAYQQAEAQRWRVQAEEYSQQVKLARRAGIKNTLIAGLACLVGGLVIGATGTFIIGGR